MDSYSTKEKEDGKVCAILAYFFPIGLIWYLVDKTQKNNKFVAYHVYQSLTMFIVLVIANIVFGLLPGILAFLSFIVPIFSLIWFIQGLINASKGKAEPLFLIGKIFEGKFTF